LGENGAGRIITIKKFYLRGVDYDFKRRYYSEVQKVRV
jgi:hypothetical protein